MIPEREREALMRLTMCARGECPMCKYEEQCDNWDFRMELATKNMNILADALRKTENCSEIPNNCEDCKHWNDTEDGCADRYGCKTEPQTIRCPKCGRSDYIREFGKDFSVTAEEAGFKYKCINCNTYIEPQSDRKTKNCSEIPNNCEHITEDGVTCAKYPACDDCLDNPLNKVKGSERLVKGSEQTDCPTCRRWSSYGYCVHRECKGYEPQTERMKTLDYCDICNHKGCDNCIANNLDDYCVPSGYEPITQTETQNSNLTFEKRTMLDCYNCKRFETEDECIECHYEPKTEPQTERSK